jgi:NAD(P)-dependent dehydrogenase (short-subunit alcohol dehydrogenase family)
MIGPIRWHEADHVMTISADLQGKVAFVTGASGGLGEHFARVLARSGAAVAVAARRIDRLQPLADAINAAGGRAFAVPLDVQDAASVRAAVAAASAELGVVDVLVNNSGIGTSGWVLDQTEAQWDSVLDTNLKGSFLVATEVARRLRDAKRAGSIINITSIQGLRQGSFVAPYSVSKAGLVQLTKVMALELGRFEIRVNALAPGFMRTDVNRELCDGPVGAAMLKRIPQRRFAELADLDGPLLLLASDASRLMTGTVIPVDGGHLVSEL